MYRLDSSGDRPPLLGQNLVTVYFLKQPFNRFKFCLVCLNTNTNIIQHRLFPSWLGILAADTRVTLILLCRQISGAELNLRGLRLIDLVRVTQDDIRSFRYTVLATGGTKETGGRWIFCPGKTKPNCATMTQIAISVTARLVTLTSATPRTLRRSDSAFVTRMAAVLSSQAQISATRSTIKCVGGCGGDKYSSCFLALQDRATC